MAIRKKSKKEQAATDRMRRKGFQQKPRKGGLSLALVRVLFGWTVFTALVILICFVGLSPAGPQIYPGQIAKIRIVAEIPFSYDSPIRTRQRAELRRKQTPPIYRLDFEPYQRFEEFIESFVREANALRSELTETNAEPQTRQEAVAAFAESVARETRFNVRGDDVAQLMGDLPEERLERVMNEGLVLLRQLYRDGIYNPTEMTDTPGGIGAISFFNVEEGQPEATRVEPQTQEQALRYLRINLYALDIPREASRILYRLFRNGLTSNLVYDPVRTEARKQAAAESTEPVRVSVSQGETIIEPETRVTDFQMEQLAVYRQRLREYEEARFTFASLLWERVLLTIAALIGAAIYVRLGNLHLRREPRRLVQAGLIVLANLALVRLALEISDNTALRPESPSILPALVPYLLPATLGPIVVAILLGTTSALFTGFIIALFTGIMLGNSFPIMVLYFLGSMVGIYYCRDIQVRTRLVQAGALAGLCLAAGAALFGFQQELEYSTIGYQMLSALSVGIVTGIVVVGLVPLLEKALGTTTDITLLELTDYNHPLLRRMQIEAPGSYHHSLMVANLAENAAAAIGANSLVCRASALFHDIGKMVKPEYFTENQRDGVNPHIMRNPSMSALVIKSHVKEGVEMAQRFKLPAVFIDIIRQHHGTSLIQYFYYKAIQKQKGATPAFYPGAPQIEMDQVNEDTYRYDGPKPDFRESAVVFFADSVEAASRSLKKVTPQAVDELIEGIFRYRIEDNQLSECPITFAELDRMKRSFSFTLLNMLHARVEYPKGERDVARIERESAGEGAADTRRIEAESADAEPSRPPAAASPAQEPPSGDTPPSANDPSREAPQP